MIKSPAPKGWGAGKDILGRAMSEEGWKRNGKKWDSEAGKRWHSLGVGWRVRSGGLRGRMRSD